MTENSNPTILSWSVKESLLQYVRALGEISYASGLVELGDELVWPLASDHHDADGVRIAEFSGAIHLRAHDGLLDIVIADPEVRVNAGTRRDCDPRWYRELSVCPASRSTGDRRRLSCVRRQLPFGYETLAIDNRQ